MNLLCAIVIAFSMYSRVPMPRISWTKERMRYMLCFFPLVGVVIGSSMLLWMKYGTYLTGEGTLYRAVMVLIPVLITGGIHVDGFLDTSDALSSYKSMEEKLEILKDSHAGAFAILSGICYFLLLFGVYSEVTLDQMRFLAVGFVLSRSMSACSIVLFKKAKNSGLAASFSDMAQQRTVGIVAGTTVFFCAVLLMWMDLFCGSVVFCTACLVFWFYKSVSYRKFGGITGDLAGFFLQICELMMALMLVVLCRVCQM